MTKKMITPITFVAISVASALAGFAPTAHAENKDRMTQLEKRIEALEADLIEAQDAAKRVDKVRFSDKTPSPEFVSKDGRSTLNFKGRIQLDHNQVDDMYTGKKREFEEGFDETKIRRLRFGLEGYFSRDWEYELELDFADSEVDLKDANVTYKGWENSQLALGFQKFAFGLGNTQSSGHQIMMERAVTDTFSPDRAIGIQWRYIGNNYNVHLGYGVDNQHDDEDEDNITNPKISLINARFTSAVVKNNNHLLHLGASYLYTKNNDDALETRYRARPSSKPAGRIIDTGKFDADNTQHYGIETAYRYRNWLLQGEYIAAKADQTEDPSLEVDAYYLMASYVITGEQWRYSGKKGAFKSPRPDKALSEGGLGAWELAVRMDKGNFSDASVDIDGGTMTDYVVGLNWYMEDNLKLQLNYIRAEAEYDNPQSKMDDLLEQDANMFQARLQFAF